MYDSRPAARLFASAACRRTYPWDVSCRLCLGNREGEMAGIMLATTHLYCKCGARCCTRVPWRTTLTALSMCLSFDLLLSQGQVKRHGQGRPSLPPHDRHRHARPSATYIATTSAVQAKQVQVHIHQCQTGVRLDRRSPHRCISIYANASRPAEHGHALYFHPWIHPLLFVSVAVSIAPGLSPP